LKFIVIGEPCADYIIKSDGTTYKSYGGILYSLITLSLLSNKNDIVFPVMMTGYDEYENIKNLLGRYENINTDGIIKSELPMRQVKLDYTNIGGVKSERLEFSTQPVESLTYEQISPYINDADAVLINLISGVDITSDAFLELRKNFKKNIHIDIHNLVLETKPDGRRSYKNPDDWKLWCKNSDTLQMNEYEFLHISKEMKNEYMFAEEVLMSDDSSVKGIIITRGKAGLSGFTKKEKTFGTEKFTDIDKQDIFAIENSHFIDSTGCGDVFAAAFTLDYNKTNNFIKSIHYANRIASYKTSLQGIEELIKLK